MMGEAGSVAESADAPVDSVPTRPLERFAVSDAASAHIPSDPPVAARRHLPSVNVRLSVSRKLYLSFGVVVGLLVAVIAVAFWAMNAMDTAHQRVSEQVLPRV